MSVLSDVKSWAPTVTVGIPVFNGDAYLAEAIESVLNQSFGDFELVISDNASTDATRDVCLEYAQKDSRIVYARQSRNVGAVSNFNYVASVARGVFFCWLAADDLLNSTFLEETVRYLQARKEVGLVAVDFRVIDLNGKGVGVERLKSLRSSVKWRVRRAHLMSKPDDNAYFAIYGLFRTQLLKVVTPLVKKVQIVSNAEYLYLSRIACLEQIESLPKVLRLYRKHPECSHLVEKRSLHASIYLVRRIKQTLRDLKLSIEQKKALFLSPLSLNEKLFSLLLIVKNRLRRFFRFEPKHINRLIRSMFTRLGYDLHRTRFLGEVEFDLPRLLSWCDVELFVDLSETDDGIFRWVEALSKNGTPQSLKIPGAANLADPERVGQCVLDAVLKAKRVILHIDAIQLRTLPLNVVCEVLRNVSGIFIVCDKSECRNGMGILDDPQSSVIINDRFSLWNIRTIKRCELHGGTEAYCFCHISKEMIK